VAAAEAAAHSNDDPIYLPSRQTTLPSTVYILSTFNNVIQPNTNNVI